MLSQLDQLNIEFEEMERKGEVNIELSLPMINRIASELKNLRDQKINLIKSPEEIFEVYHLSLVSLIVLENIRGRLKVAKENQDNPKIALNSLAVLPNIKEAVVKLQEERVNKTFLDLASQIQLNASLNNLFTIQKDKMDNLSETIFEIVDEINSSQEYGRA
ncbi:hypothetical protein HY449_00625 [Candidatus Pacearchaeota archaeon]|nr:hypothetical protein [Candidatus Pacearchaeota archaeon]